MANLMTTSPRIPELCAGEVLTRDEFHRRYSAMPHVKKAELIEGVVYMGSPVRFDRHSRPEGAFAAWVALYREFTPGLHSGTNATVRVDLDNEPQPDVLLCIPESAGGQSCISVDGYIEGAPELIVEVAASSVSYDLHQKKDVYRRSGVREYLVLRVDDGELDWFVLRAGAYVRQSPDADGLLHSVTFPGLTLDPGALLREDFGALRRRIEVATRTAEHAAFVQRLRAAGQA